MFRPLPADVAQPVEQRFVNRRRYAQCRGLHFKAQDERPEGLRNGVNFAGEASTLALECLPIFVFLEICHLALGAIHSVQLCPHLGHSRQGEQHLERADWRE
jgi:hypothetical protein